MTRRWGGTVTGRRLPARGSSHGSQDAAAAGCAPDELALLEESELAELPEESELPEELEDGSEEPGALLAAAPAVSEDELAEELEAPDDAESVE